MVARPAVDAVSRFASHTGLLLGVNDPDPGASGKVGPSRPWRRKKESAACAPPGAGSRWVSKTVS